MAYSRRKPYLGRLALRIALGVTATALFLVALELGALFVETVDPADSPRPRDPLGDINLAPKQPGTYRILLYGGSTVEGEPLRELSFPPRLEFWLRKLEPGKPLELINLGKSGQNSTGVFRAIRRSIGAAPDLLIVLTAHNEFLRRDLESPLDGLADMYAVSRILTRLVNKARALAGIQRDHAMPDRLVPYDRTTRTFSRKIERYEKNLKRIAKLAQKHRVPLILATAPSNIADWPPVYRRLRDLEYERVIEEVKQLLWGASYEQARGRIQLLAGTYPDDPMLLFLLGRAEAGRGRYERAKPLLLKARDRDPYPWRILSDFNGMIRATSDVSGVVLADIEAAFERHAPGGLVGFDLIADNCHPTPKGSSILARELLEVMAREGFFLSDLRRLPDLSMQMKIFTSASSRTRASKNQELAYLLANAKYAMKVPFFNFEASERYLRRALELAPQDWRIWANLASVSLLTARTEDGLRQLQRATLLHEGPLDPDDRSNTPYLREALKAARRAAPDG